MDNAERGGLQADGFRRFRGLLEIGANVAFLLLLAFLGACGRHHTLAPSDSGLHVVIRLPVSSPAGAFAVLGTTPVSIDSLEVEALTEDLDGSWARQAHRMVPVGLGATQIEVSLDVSIASRYLIRAYALGERQRSGQTNFTTRGIQFAGEGMLEGMGSQGETATLTLEDVVPLPTLRRGQADDSLNWNAIRFAERYTVRDTSGVLANALADTVYHGSTTRYGYRVRSELRGGAASAYSEAIGLEPSAPIITGVEPDSVVAGTLSVNLVVSGRNFDLGAVVLRDDEGADLATTGSSTRLTAAVPAEFISYPYTHMLAVRNSSGLVSNSVAFVVMPRPPTITSLSPDSAMVGGAAFTLILTGRDFQTGAVVLWNGDSISAVLGQSPQELVASISSGRLTSVGNVSVQVRNPDRQVSNALPFRVVAPTPILSTVDPDTVVAGAPTFTLTLSGSSFVNGAVATWGGTELATTFVSGSRITAQVPTSLIQTSGSASVLVRNPGGKTSSPVSALVTPWRSGSPMINSGFVAAASAQGKIYTVGYFVGQAPNSAREVRLGTFLYVDVYDPSSDLWTAGPGTPGDSWGACAAAVNDQLYVFGYDIYDLSAGSWSKQSLGSGVSWGAAATANNRVYILGGRRAYSGPMAHSVLEFFPGPDSVRLRASIPTPRVGVAAALLNGRIYVMGGADSLGVVSRVVEIYDPVANSWTTGPQMQFPRAYFSAGVVGGKILVVGGVGDLAQSVESYDPATLAWRTKTPPATLRSYLASAVVGDTLYSIGGCERGCRPYGQSQFTRLVDAYFPLRDSAGGLLRSGPSARRRVSLR